MGDQCSGGVLIGDINTPRQKPTRVEINKVSNGYIIGGYGVEQKIANTLAEALELTRKEFDM